jgi:MoaA/NifB/PqqE/SkfB family radical SAM enzyme
LVTNKRLIKRNENRGLSMSINVDEKSYLLFKSNWEHLSVEFTTFCNLRCVYCKGGAGSKSQNQNALLMDTETARNVMAAAKIINFCDINLNGSGEFTTMPNWVSLIREFPKAAEQSLYLVSNFAKIFSDAELDALLYMDRIYISLDSANKNLLKLLRPPVDIRTITYNLLKLKVRALLLKRKMPFVRINCVVSNLNGTNLEDLSGYCVYLGVDEIEFFPLNVTENAEHNGLKSFSSLSENEIKEISKQLEKACRMLSAHTIKYRITDELKRILSEPSTENSDQQKILDGCREPGCDQGQMSSLANPKIKWQPEPNKTTRICLQPWKRILIGANGYVYPCCRKSIVMGDLRKKSLLKIIEDKPLITLRKALLSGNLAGTKCYHCANAPLGGLDMLEERIVESAGEINPPDKQKLENSSRETKLRAYRVIPPGRSIYYARLDGDFIDYQVYSIEGVAPYGFRGPSPGGKIPKDFVSCIGAAQTFGRFVEHPYPALLQQKIAELPVLNLGLPGAGPAAYLLSPSIIELVNNGNSAIIQIFSGRSASNRHFKSSGFSNGKRISDGADISALNAFIEIYQNYTLDQIKDIVEETTVNWLADFKVLLEQIRVPKILLWFSVKAPPQTHNLESRESLLGSFPHLVTQELLTDLTPYAQKYVEVITKRGIPQKIYSADGKEIELMICGKMTTKNTYYPSPEMHMDVADALTPVLKTLL